jgi:hypothetical protein
MARETGSDSIMTSDSHSDDEGAEAHSLNLEQLIPPKVLKTLAKQFGAIVAELQLADIDKERQILNRAIQEALLMWLDKVVKEAFKCLLDEHGYLKARVAFELGWSSDQTLYKPENIQAITFSFLKTFIQHIIKNAFPEHQAASEFLSPASGFVNDLALGQLQKNLLIKPLRCHDYSKCISREFDTTPIECRIAADYMVLRWLLQQLRDKKKIPETELMTVLKTAYSRCNDSGVLVSIMQKYYKLAEYSLGSLDETNKLGGECSRDATSFFSTVKSDSPSQETHTQKTRNTKK